MLSDSTKFGSKNSIVEIKVLKMKKVEGEHAILTINNYK